MQRTKIALAALATAALSACAHGAAAPAPVSCPAPDSAITEVAQVMRDMYTALTKDDLDGWHAAITKDFFSFDVGKRFDGDALFDVIKTNHAKGTVYVWTVNDPRIDVACDMALITYVNTGSVTPSAGATRNVSWLESATMKHDGQRWRISFFHSTSVPEPVRPQ
ncbi:MAG: nuclear transport factor 2 family protein [Hyphomonadaceae bacterium]|nr:nuclear transport factor 2 family protein [Hyphomonadaceae bacterium]